MDDGDRPLNRKERRKQRTRAALIKAAQGFLAAGKVNAPIQDISQVADVGVGSFYNHFDSKEELFEAAINEILDAQGILLDALAATSEDPAETFARSFRIAGRMFRRRPDESAVILAHGLPLITSDRGLGPRSKRDIAAAAAAGRFQVEDPALAMAVAGGALLGLGQLLHNEPDRDDVRAVDQVTQSLLQIFGMSAEEAHRLCQQPLPFLDDVDAAGSVA